MNADKTTSPADTKTRILDAAEKLFAENGFKHTSIKQLAQIAGVNQAAVNYHFGSKHALIEKVIERRLSLIDHRRMQALEKIDSECVQKGCRPNCRDILQAMIEPAFNLAQVEPGEKSFLLIIGRAFAEPDETIRRIFIRLFKPSFSFSLALIKKALPEIPEAVLWWRLHFAIGAMAHCMRVCGADVPVAGIYPPTRDPGTVMKLLVSFLDSAMQAPLAPEGADEFRSL